MIRVGIVEDHPIFAAAVSTALEREGFDVIFVAHSLQDASDRLAHEVVDGVLLDLVLPDGAGLDLIHGHRDPRNSSQGPWFVVLSSLDDAATLAGVERAGCRGFVSKLATPERIAGVLRDASRGRTNFDQPRTVSDGEERRSQLSPRERACLALVAEGLGNRDIAEVLGVSPETVKTHLDAVRQKLGAADRAQAVAIGVRLRLI